jgi:hypothetical protein
MNVRSVSMSYIGILYNSTDFVYYYYVLYVSVDHS